MDNSPGVKLDLSQIISHPIVLAQGRRASLAEQQQQQGEQLKESAAINQPALRTPAKKALGQRALANSRNSLESTQSTPSSSPVEPLSMDSTGSFEQHLDERVLVRRTHSVLAGPCTLRRRASRVSAYGVYTGELASPEPKVRLANFSITPYAESRRLARRSHD